MSVNLFGISVGLSWGLERISRGQKKVLHICKQLIKNFPQVFINQNYKRALNKQIILDLSTFPQD